MYCRSIRWWAKPTTGLLTIFVVVALRRRMFLRRLRVQRADWLKRGLSARELEQWRLAGREALEQHRADCPVVSAGTQSAFWYRRILVECLRLQGLLWGRNWGNTTCARNCNNPGVGETAEMARA